MATTIEQIAAIEKEIRETPYHKGTEHHIGKLRARLAKLKEKEEVSASRKSGGGGGYGVRKQGDATVVLVGPPSAGKSTLINRLTNAKSKIAPYAFTTVTVIPGMMVHRDARIQILDVPGLIEGAAEGKGRGREVLSVVRGADLVILITDPERLTIIETIKASLERNGIRLDSAPPQVRIDKKLSGGLLIKSNIRQELDIQTIKEVAGEFGIKNAEIFIKEKLSMETLIDAFARNRVYVPTLTVINKSDIQKIDDTNVINISAERGDKIEELKDKIFETLGFITIFLVKPREDPHKNSPMIMKKGESLFDLAQKIGSEFAQDKQNAKIWGPGSKFPGQITSIKNTLTDQMMVMFI